MYADNAEISRSRNQYPDYIVYVDVPWPDDRRAVSLRIAIHMLPVVTLAVAGCAATPPGDVADAQQHYLAAKATCVSAYPRSLTQQAECRVHAANIYIRPYYRYGDLMTYVQARRQE